MALSKWPLKGWIFCTQGAKNETPPETLKLKVREVSQIGFWNISWQPTSVPSFSQIGWPQLLAPGTLSQTMTLKSATKRHETWCRLEFISRIAWRTNCYRHAWKRNLDRDKNNPKISGASVKNFHLTLAWAKENFPVLRDLLGPIEPEISIFSEIADSTL